MAQASPVITVNATTLTAQIGTSAQNTTQSSPVRPNTVSQDLHPGMFQISRVFVFVLYYMLQNEWFQKCLRGQGPDGDYDCAVSGAFEATGRQQCVGLPETEKLNFISRAEGMRVSATSDHEDVEALIVLYVKK